MPPHFFTFFMLCCGGSRPLIVHIEGVTVHTEAVEVHIEALIVHIEVATAYIAPETVPT